MSAYVVAAHHINALITFAANNRVTYFWQGRHRDIVGDEARCASVLYAENVRSVNTRYSETEPAHGFRFEYYNRIDLPAIQYVAACHCFEYQACEASDWDDSEAKAIVSAIESRAISKIPGYESAVWGMPEPADNGPVLLSSLVTRAAPANNAVTKPANMPAKAPARPVAPSKPARPVIPPAKPADDDEGPF